MLIGCDAFRGLMPDLTVYTQRNVPFPLCRGIQTLMKLMNPLRPDINRKPRNAVRWLAVVVFASAFALLRSILLRSVLRSGLHVGDTSVPIASSHSNDTVALSKGATIPIEYKGKDIVLITGSDGHHPLDVHAKEIKANREDYAAFHGREYDDACIC